MSRLNLKNFLKSLKLNESNISMVLGGLVIVVVGILIVNYFKDKGGETLNGVNTQTESKEHVVLEGETLWSIAEDSFGSGYNWVDLKSANNLSTETIEVGQKLAIPDVAAKQPTAAKVAETETVESIATSSYTVERGDSLWTIAVRAYGDGYRWVEIAEANSLDNPNIIHAGNILALPRK